MYFNIICSFPLFKLEITLFIHNIVCMPDCEISIFLQSKNPTSGVQLKPIHSRFSKHNYSMMTDEAIETAASEFGSEKLYIAGLLESDN